MGMRPYWADYANHMLRFYCRNDDPTMIYRFRTRTDEKNWKACNSVMKGLNRRDDEVIRFVYGGTMFLEDAVNEYLASHPNEQSDAIWNTIYTVSRRVAQVRGLL